MQIILFHKESISLGFRGGGGIWLNERQTHIGIYGTPGWGDEDENCTDVSLLISMHPA